MLILKIAIRRTDNFLQKSHTVTCCKVFFSAITAAVVGVVFNLAVWFAIHTIFRETFPVHALLMDFAAPKLTNIDLRAFGLAAVAAAAIFRFKIGMISTAVDCMIAGLAS